MNASQKWLAEQERFRVERKAQAKPAYFNSFNDYVAKFPAGERWRDMVTKKEILVATYEGQSCLEGDYLIAYIRRRFDREKREYAEPTHVMINNGDDGYYNKKVSSEKEAREEIENLKLLAPFCGSDLKDFGYIGE